MTMPGADVEARARLSLGRSHQRIYQTVADLLAARGAGGVLADIGCGTGDLWEALRGRFQSCVGVDAVRYDGLPADVAFHAADLDAAPLPLADASVDVAAAVEVIEHLENPRAVRPRAGPHRPARRLGRRHDAESVERAEPPHAGRQGTVLRVPGRHVPGPSHGAARNRSAPDARGMRAQRSRRSPSPGSAACR